MSTKFRDFLNEQLKDEDFRREYEALELERTIIQALIDARKTSSITREELSARTGIPKSVISKIETASFSPSIRTLRRLAEGIGMRLKLELQPA